MKLVSLASFAQRVPSVGRAVSFSLAVVSCLCLLLATERQAHAYIDPSSGLLALQSLFAGLATAGYFLRRRVAQLFGRGKKPAATVAIAQPAPTSIRKDDTRSAA
jgi:hypothetical protein